MFRRLILSGSILLLNGCALTKTVTQVNYVPKVDQSAVAGIHGRNVVLGKFADARAVEDPAVIFHKRNGYNMTMSGAYMAPQPVVDYVKQGVDASLRAAGIVSENAGLVLNGSLEDLDEEVQMGFWSSKMQAKMTVKFSLTENGKAIWNDTFVGKALIAKGNFAQQTVVQTTDDVVRQLMANAQFREAIAKAQ